MSRRKPLSKHSSPRCAAATELVLVLRPHPAAALLAAAAVMSPLLVVLLLAGRRQGWHALAGAITTAGLARALWCEWTGRGRVPRHLHLGTDGSLQLDFGEGGVEPVCLGASSLLLGRGMLLVLHGRRCYRLWLGPANASAQALAMLRRVLLRRARAAPTGNSPGDLG